jgi:hypothetical protein
MAGSASHQGERRSIKRQQELGACKRRGVKANALCHPLGSKSALFCFLRGSSLLFFAAAFSGTQKNKTIAASTQRLAENLIKVAKSRRRSQLDAPFCGASRSFHI